MLEKTYAVIAGELAENSKFSQELLGKIPDIIRNSIHAVNKTCDKDYRMEFEIIRMDEFMGIIQTPAGALQSLIMLAAEFRNRSFKELQLRMDLKLSLAIGPVELIQKDLRESDGTAVRKAMDNLKSMKRNQRLCIYTPEKGLTEEFVVSSGFMDILIHDWSDEQAEALVLRLSGMNQMKISEELKISQPAVNRRLKAAHHEAINKFLKRFNNIYS